MPPDLASVFEELDADDAAARAEAAPGDEFATEFTVPRFSFRNGSGPVPLKLASVPALSDRPLPVPADAEVTADGRFEMSLPPQARRTDLTVKKVMSARAAHLSIASGTIVNGSEATEFVALGEPGTREFRISVHGSYASDRGTLYSAAFAGDGSVLPAALDEGNFVADCDGSLFRLDEGPGGTTLSEAEFGSLRRIEFTREADFERAVLVGSLRLGEEGEPFAARVEFAHGPTRSTLSVVDTDNSEQRVLGVAPSERVEFRLIGGLDAAPPTPGAVVLYERGSWRELRSFAVDGALAGLGWDGSFLWQARWPAGEMVRIDPDAADGAPTVVPGPPGGKVAGVAFDGSVLLLGVCASDILRGSGDTYLAEYDPASAAEVGRIRREHSMSSGISIGPEGLVGAVDGADQTPISADSALLLVDRETGNIMDVVIFPRNFFIEDVDQASATSAFVTVTEGLSGFKRPGAVYEVDFSAPT